jgi:hypothetical protein
MTTEVAILNKEAVALAADSAVTVRMPNGDKIYNSANKLFELSKFHPVGIMIYGNAQLTGVPWETLIKIYREKLGNKSFPKLLDYCNDFISFLKQNTSLFPERDQINYIRGVVSSAFEEIRDAIHDKVIAVFEKNEKLSKLETEEIIESAIQNYYEELEKLEMLPSFSKASAIDFKRKYKPIFDELMDEVFDELPLRRTNKNKLLKISLDLFVKDHFSPLASGIAISGFGEEEVFPLLYAYQIEFVIGDQLKYAKQDNKSFEGGPYPAIVPFAQEDMIYAFIEGIDRRVEGLSLVTLVQILDNYSEAIFEKAKDILSIDESNISKLNNELKGLDKQLMEKYHEEMINYRNKLHVAPLLTTVSFLPKDELGAMAEALVNLTSLKRRVTTDSETVGGPTDVAVISKGDGFIWMARKHYFRAELNRNFFNRG